MRVPSAGLWLDLAPSEVVRRELLREVGGAAADLRFVGQFYASGGISGDVAYVDLATGVASPDCCWSGTWAGHTANPPGVFWRAHAKDWLRSASCRLLKPCAWPSRS